MDYRYLRWQILDTPGILDHPLDQRNTVEMQAITALAHLRASVLYFIDISEQCGWNIEQQCKLCESIKPLFANKPLVIVMTKTDLIDPDTIPVADQERIQKLAQGEGVILLPMSTMSEQGVADVVKAACDSLLQQRTQIRLRGKRMSEIANRVHVAMPTPRDDKERPPVEAPAKLEDAMEVPAHRFTAKHLKDENDRQAFLFEEFDPDFKGIDHRDRYDLEDPEWRHDIIPEIMDGKNIFDFWSADIEEKLQALEQEEAAMLRRLAMQDDTEEDYTLTPEQLSLVKRIREKRALMVQQSRLKKGTTDAILPRTTAAQTKTLSDLETHLQSLGLDSSLAATRVRDESRSRSRSRPAREVSESRTGRKRSRSELASRSRSKTPGVPGSGFRDEEQFDLADRLAKRAKRELSRDGRRGESDRHVFDWKPKHLLSGKRGMGKTDRR
jgi:nucleolar GTP-binding protein